MINSSIISTEEDAEPPLESVSGKTLLLINTGSPNKRFILDRIKDLGVTIVMLNTEKNWAAPFVDHWILADTYNHRECVDSVKKFLSQHADLKIDGATTFWEDDVPLLARICEEFHLVGNNMEVAQNTRSKFHMQEVFREKGRPFIPHFLLKNSGDLESAALAIGFPAVIKPKYGADSQYVVYVRNIFEAREAYEYVKENCTPEFDPIYYYNKGEFVYQKFIEGREFSVECYIQDGIPHVAGINEKTGMNLPFFVETGDYCPPRTDTVQTQVLIEEAKAALLSLEVKNSLAHIEIKLTQKEPVVIEVASRMGGVYIYKNVKQAYGFDLIKAACEIAFGVKITDKPIGIQKCLLAKFFIPQTSGVITAMTGFDALQNDKRVVDYYIGKNIQDKISIPPEGYETAGWVIAGGKSYSEAEKNMNDIMNVLHLQVSALEKEKIFTSIPVRTISKVLA